MGSRGSRPTAIGCAVVGCAIVGSIVGGCEPVDYVGDDYATGIGLPRRQVIDDAAEATDGGTPARSSAAAGSASPAGCTADGGCDASLPDRPAQPVTQTFTLVAGDCGGGRCSGGYDDEKNPAQLTTANKLCADRGYVRATDFTIGGQPGGRFCSYNGSAYGCDDSCDGCNVMTTVTCAK
jgi:hypothetical protein